MSSARRAPALPPSSLRSDHPLNRPPAPSCKERGQDQESGALSPPEVPTAAKPSFSTSHKKRCDGFRPWQNGVPFLALQAKTVKAERKI